MFVNEDFVPKKNASNRLPPGQYSTTDFPVLSLGPTPDINRASWKLEIKGLVESSFSLSLEELQNLPGELWIKDIHCVTKWSKFDTKWRGVSVDALLEKAKPLSHATHIIAHSADGYTTNIPLEDVTENKALVAFKYDSDPIDDEHGGPIRLIVPHLYFWKSAKWLTGIELVDRDIPGFWETRGYHNYGDPWKEQRYTFD